MNQTTNLHLPQFEATDRIHHDDFNDAFQKLDAMPHIVTGSYTGDGQAERTISLGFTPKAVLVVRQDGFMAYSGSYYHYGGLAVEGCVSKTMYGTQAVVAVAEGGFKVYVKDDEGCHAQSNLNNQKYNYIAIG